jgi:hypothetical protein
LKNPNTNFQARNRYDIGPLKLTLNLDSSSFIDIEVSINKGVAQTKLKQVETSSDYFSIKFNGEEINLGSTKNAAKSNVKSAMGKFLGDALQYIIVNLRNKQKRVNVRAFGTGDGMAAVLCAFIAKQVFREDPVMILDSAQQSSELTLFGFGGFGERVKLNLVGNRMTQNTSLTRNSAYRNESNTAKYLRRQLGSNLFNSYSNTNKERLIGWANRQKTNELTLPNGDTIKSYIYRQRIEPENVTSKPMELG